VRELIRRLIDFTGGDMQDDSECILGVERGCMVDQGGTTHVPPAGHLCLARRNRVEQEGSARREVGFKFNQIKSNQITSHHIKSNHIKSRCVHSLVLHFLGFFPMKFREATLVHLYLSGSGLRAQGLGPRKRL
jgi:hypothetical protein